MAVNEEAMVERIRRLPANQQRAVEQFIERLEQRATGQQSGSPIGLCADLGEHISAEEIDEARREMWGDFPHSDI
ncbi:MAG TPA: hypothetical protein VJX67_15155 [Blastocatellia bacterium]|nr:hypothetical protein [Blastocatellia bacterium]